MNHTINIDATQQFIPLHRFSPTNLCHHIETWIRDDINYKNYLSQTRNQFMRRELHGKSIISQPLHNTTDILRIDLSPLVTPKTLKIILSYCQKMKQEHADDVASKSAEQIADLFFNYPLNKLLKHITDEGIDGIQFIQSIYQHNKDIIAEETGWDQEEAYQIHSVLFRYHTFTQSQFKQNMDDILNNKYGNMLSKNIIQDIKQLMTQQDVEDIHCKIKNALAIDEFSDAVMILVDEYVQNNNTNDDKTNESIVHMYKAIAECFIYREDYESKDENKENNDTILKLQHWICNNCGDCNVNAYIDNRFTTKITVCTLCGMHQRDQIILKLRNHDSYIMVNDVNMERYEMDPDIDREESEDKSIDIMIREAIKADGWFHLLCPNKNSQDSCVSVLRLAKRLIQYKRWLHTIHKKKGCDPIKTVNVDIAKYIDNNIYKHIFADVVNKMELITKHDMQSAIQFIQTHSHLLSIDLFMKEDSKNKRTFLEILQPHIKLSEACVNKLYKLAAKTLKKLKTDKIDQDALKRILIEKVHFIQKQSALLIKIFEANADNIADIKLFTEIKQMAFAKIIRANTAIDIPTGIKLYRNIKEPLKQSAQTQQFGQFLCDLDLEIIRKDYHHILQMHIKHGNNVSITNVFRFFQKIIHYDDNGQECRSKTRKKKRLKETDTNGTDTDTDTRDIWELKQFYIQSELDIIHCHLAHSDVRRALKEHKYKDHDEKSVDHENIEYDDDDRAQNDKFVTELSESDTANYGFGINHEHPYLNPVHDSIHDELLLNELSYRFGVKQWQNALVKAIKKRDLLQYETHNLKCNYYQKQYNIIRNECINLRHLCALIIYADSTEFCTMFRKTYRKLEHETTNNVIQKHQQLYYYAKSLYESIEFFGKKMSRKLKVYHGLNRILFFSKFTAFFNQPISTSLDINIANSFSKGCGIILTLRAAPNQFDKHKKPKYLSISWLSSFPNEDEYLFYGQYVVFNICNIHNVEFDENKKTTNLKEHSSELLRLGEFQKIISNARVTYTCKKDSERRKIEALVELINRHHNNVDDAQKPYVHTEYISKFGNELFSYFCKNQKSIWIYNFVELPPLLRNALLLHSDHHQSPKYEAQISIMQIAKLFINVQEIVLNGLNIKQMAAAADSYIQSVFKYVKTSKEMQMINLKVIIFKSKAQNDNKPNATLQNVANKYESSYRQYDWELNYELSVEKTHNIVFRKHLSNDEQAEEISELKRQLEQAEAVRLNLQKASSINYSVNSDSEERLDVETQIDNIEDDIREVKDMVLSLMDATSNIEPVITSNLTPLIHKIDRMYQTHLNNLKLQQNPNEYDNDQSIGSYGMNYDGRLSSEHSYNTKSRREGHYGSWVAFISPHINDWGPSIGVSAIIVSTWYLLIKYYRGIK